MAIRFTPSGPQSYDPYEQLKKDLRGSSGGGGSQQQEPATSGTPNKPTLLRDEKGNTTGVKLPDGRTYLGISRDEAVNLANKYADELENLYYRGGEHKIRERLSEIDNEIMKELKNNPEYANMKVPDMESRLRVITKGYEDQRTPMTK